MDAIIINNCYNNFIYKINEFDYLINNFNNKFVKKSLIILTNGLIKSKLLQTRRYKIPDNP